MEKKKTKTRLDRVIKKFISQVAQDQNLSIQKIDQDSMLVDDLGFGSLDIATLVSLLEIEFDVDPFSNNRAVYTELQTVGDLYRLYERSLFQNSVGNHEDETKRLLEKNLRRGESRKGSLSREKK